MIRNYLLTAWRSLLRNKIFSAINIIGLAVSMSVCLLAIQIIAEQYATDRSNPLKDRIYRVNTIRHDLGSGRETKFASSALAIEDELKSISGIEETATIRERFAGDADTGNKVIPISGYYASENFFRVFNIGLEAGNLMTALSQPYSVVLTKETAEKLYHAGETIIGRSLEIGDMGEFTITGIVATDNPKTHVENFGVLASINTLPMLEEKEVIRNVTTDFSRYYISFNYFVLKEGVDPASIDPFLDNIVNQHYPPTASRTVALEHQNILEINPAIEERSNELGFAVPFLAIVFIAGLALLILLTATFNYTNLSIAKALTRMKEVGVRKVSGASRIQVFNQFIVESVLVSFIALGGGFLLLQLIVPQFFALDPNINRVMQLRNDPTVWLWFTGFTVFVGLLAGVLPALILSRLQAINVLKGAQGVSLMKHLGLRKTLIVIQFALSIIFVTTAVLLNKQFEFSLNYDFGFDRENIVNLDLQGQDYNLVATEMERIAGVNSSAGLGYVMGLGRLWAAYARNPELPDSISMAFQPVDQKYIPQMKHHFLAGSNFSELASDSTMAFVILNEKAVNELEFGSPMEAIGKVISLDESDVEIVGVVEDFNYSKVTQPIGAFAFQYDPGDINILCLSVDGAGIQHTLAGIETTWQKIDEVHEIQMDFYDDQVAETYVGLRVLNKLIGFVAFLAITISVLGLLGMVIYSTQSRLKEVGIRKVLGANSGRLVWVLSRGYALLLLIAIFFAVPLSIVINKLWMQNLSFRTSIEFLDIFAGVGVILMLGLLIVGSQTYLASIQNPSDTLRDE